MNLLADALQPYLYANAIDFVRNTPEMTAASSIRQANAIGGFDFYLALHSNASPEAVAGQNRGIIAFYYPGSARGQRGASLIAEELRKVYPLPDLVRTQPTTSLGEVRQPRAPAVLVEIGYHDNYEDAVWVETNRPAIAEALARALTAYFNVPFLYPANPIPGTVRVTSGTLNLRSRPSSDAPVTANLPNGAAVTVYNEWEGWNVVRWQDRMGYAAAAYIET